MSLSAEQILGTCAAAQLTSVAPALEGTYAGGTAGTIGALLILAAQDIAARPKREAAELARLQEIFARARTAGLIDSQPSGLVEMRAGLEALHKKVEESAQTDICTLILDHYVATAEGFQLMMPELG